MNLALLNTTQYFAWFCFENWVQLDHITEIKIHKKPRLKSLRRRSTERDTKRPENVKLNVRRSTAERWKSKDCYQWERKYKQLIRTIIIKVLNF